MPPSPHEGAMGSRKVHASRTGLTTVRDVPGEAVAVGEPKDVGGGGVGEAGGGGPAVPAAAGVRRWGCASPLAACSDEKPFPTGS